MSQQLQLSGCHRQAHPLPSPLRVTILGGQYWVSLACQLLYFLLFLWLPQRQVRSPTRRTLLQWLPRMRAPASYRSAPQLRTTPATSPRLATSPLCGVRCRLLPWSQQGCVQQRDQQQRLVVQWMLRRLGLLPSVRCHGWVGELLGCWACDLQMMRLLRMRMRMQRAATQLPLRRWKLWKLPCRCRRCPSTRPSRAFTRPQARLWGVRPSQLTSYEQPRRIAKGSGTAALVQALGLALPRQLPLQLRQVRVAALA